MFAPNTKSPFGCCGVGARDFQKSACRNHDQSKVHLAAMEAERLAQGTEVRQRSLLDMLSTDPVMARVIKCMQGASWYAFGEFIEAMAEHLAGRLLVDIKESASEALAAKDAAKSFPEFNIVDQMIRQTAERLGRSSTDHKTYMHLQDVILQTHLEVQGFCAVRWLSRGDAVHRFCDVLPVLMWMWTKDKEDKTKRIATSFKFHFMLYLLADVLQLLNGLNLAFQKKTVDIDITEVKNHVDKVKTKLSQYYVEPGASNGPNDSRLNTFIAAHGSKDKRKLELKGVDESGSPATATVELHEDAIVHGGGDGDGDGGGCDLESCVDLARRFAQRLIKALGKRMANLRHFDGVGFFSPDRYSVCAGE
ncbi:unnamed protein product [Closterium sp. Naga37s-1]|nr:unnamed protein product [Closterium sp. Naga37s-1]